VARMVATDITRRIIEQPMPEHILLNVNIPITTPGAFKGMKICRQAYAKWEEEFDHRVDPRGKDYYWMTGKFVNMDQGQETDVEALKNNYASVVPVKFDLTDVTMKTYLQEHWKDMV
jgi:5'-nucleotidase